MGHGGGVVDGVHERDDILRAEAQRQLPNGPNGPNGSMHLLGGGSLREDPFEALHLLGGGSLCEEPLEPLALGELLLLLVRGVAEDVPLLEGLDTLILDCLRPTPHPTHFSLPEALAVAAKVKARRTLLIHMSHDLPHAATQAGLPPGVELAYDGLVVPLTTG